MLPSDDNSLKAYQNALENAVSLDDYAHIRGSKHIEVAKFEIFELLYHHQNLKNRRQKLLKLFAYNRLQSYTKIKNKFPKMVLPLTEPSVLIINKLNAKCSLQEKYELFELAVFYQTEQNLSKKHLNSIRQHLLLTIIDPSNNATNAQQVEFFRYLYKRWDEAKGHLFATNLFLV